MTGQKLASEGVASRLKRARLDQGLSQRKLCELAELSSATVRQIEASKHRMPVIDTVEKLAAALGVSNQWLAYGDESMPEFSCWIPPGFDPTQMHAELLALLHGQGGHIEQSFKYLDTAGASNWLQFVRQPDYAAYIESLPLGPLAEVIGKQVTSPEMDLVGLGAGSARHEVRMMHSLASSFESARLFLLDISQPLLTIGLHHARDSLATFGNVSVWGIQGDFHKLSAYLPALRSTKQRQRVYCMFGNTFGNLDNEIRFLQSSFSAASSGDLLLLDVSLVRAPASRPNEVLTKDPAFGSRPPEFRKRMEDFITEPIRRLLPESKMTVRTELNTSCCTIPGSYSIDFRASLQPGKTFSVAYAKRYEPSQLAERLKSEGWELVDSWRYSEAFNPSLLALFRYKPRKRRSAGLQ
jgi:uncharacterized SAM-dependent methyltransferase/DNA-binding XRE family transcriptional regulator